MDQKDYSSYKNTGKMSDHEIPNETNRKDKEFIRQNTRLHENDASRSENREQAYASRFSVIIMERKQNSTDIALYAADGKLQRRFTKFHSTKLVKAVNEVKLDKVEEKQDGCPEDAQEPITKRQRTNKEDTAREGTSREFNSLGNRESTRQESTLPVSVSQRPRCSRQVFDDDCVVESCNSNNIKSSEEQVLRSNLGDRSPISEGNIREETKREARKSRIYRYTKFEIERQTNYSKIMKRVDTKNESRNERIRQIQFLRRLGMNPSPLGKSDGYIERLKKKSEAAMEQKECSESSDSVSDVDRKIDQAEEETCDAKPAEEHERKVSSAKMGPTKVLKLMLKTAKMAHRIRKQMKKKRDRLREEFEKVVMEAMARDKRKIEKYEKEILKLEKYIHRAKAKRAESDSSDDTEEYREQEVPSREEICREETSKDWKLNARCAVVLEKLP